MAEDRSRIRARIGAALSISDQRLARMFATSLPGWCRWWILLSVLAAAARGIFTIGKASPLQSAVLAGALTAPAIVLLYILRHFSTDRLHEPSSGKPPRIGRWRHLDVVECRSLEAYGTAGLLSMLLGGLLLNIPVRAFEFLTAMPTPLIHAPDWYLMLYSLMLTDLMLLSTCYAALVGLAIRHVPRFPRLLLATWLLDILMQCGIGAITSGYSHMPHAVEAQLEALLTGNIKKVAISMAIWLPYLILSPRVNLTFRHRVPARALRRSGRIR
jgi:hypothetical protein